MADLKNSSAVLAGIAERIDREHGAVQTAFKMSLDHAMAAGDLLLEAKKVVRHGEWIHWLKMNCSVSARLAQTYMKLARGRDLIETKNEGPSYLSIEAALKLLVQPMASGTDLFADYPSILPPSEGHCLIGTYHADIGEDIAYVMPSATPGFFHLASMFVEDPETTTLVTSTNRPVSTSAIGYVLVAQGFPADDADWKETESSGPTESNPWNEEMANA